MLDLKFIRNNTDIVRTAVNNKGENANIDEIINLDENRRKLQFQFDEKKAEQNKKSKLIGKYKKEKKDTSKIIKDMKSLSAEIKDISQELNDVKNSLNLALDSVPNIPSKDTPIGDSEKNNKFIREYGKKRKFDFVPKKHFEICNDLNLIDMKRAAKVAGSGFALHFDKGAQLERALINFMIDFHTKKHGYLEMSPPLLVNRNTMRGTGQLPKLESDMYRVDEEDFFLIPTAEVPVTNYFSNEILPLEKLPAKFVSYTPCFRREAGSYGKDTKGLQRLHQFNKVEMVRIVKPQDSYQILEEMVEDAEDILKALDLKYRVMQLASGDLSFASAKTYDLEVWAPASEKYLEVSSISNFEDFQARRSSIKYRDENGKAGFVHTLNGSGLATPRTMIAILEKYQRKDGHIDLPDALKPYIGGKENI